MLRRTAPLFALVVIASLITREVKAQSIANRVANVRDGKVRMTFASRPEVCGGGNWISRGGNSRMNWSNEMSSDVIYDEECSHSPVRLVLSVDNGRVVKLRTYVGGRWRPATSGTVDLGVVSTRDATSYLLSLASSDTHVGREAIMPATLADSVRIWPQLTRIARSESISSSTRKQAMFWLGQAAGDAIAPERNDRDSDDSEVKKSAVFALSQRRNGEAVPALIQVARNNRDPEVRRSALFWLGQSGDARAVSLFEEILSRYSPQRQSHTKDWSYQMEDPRSEIRSRIWDLPFDNSSL